MILTLIAYSSLILTCFMCAGYTVAQLKRDISIVDIMWGMGFAIVAWFCLWYRSLFTSRQIITTVLVTLWAIRLTGYILVRKQGEDSRYSTLKAQWGKNASLYIFIFIFLLQGFFILCISSPIIVINASSLTGLTLLDFLGISVWIFGISYETIADWQLFSFLNNPNNKGKVLQSGLWKYSRHPNYFGELILWCGIALISLNVPYGWCGIIAPLTLLYIFFYLSIPTTEKIMLSSPEFITYKETTRVLIPGLKKGY